MRRDLFGDERRIGTIHLVLTLKDGSRAKMYLPDDVNADAFIEAIREVTTNSTKPTVLGLVEHGTPEWHPSEHLSKSMLVRSGYTTHEVRSFRTPFAFWLPEAAADEADLRIAEALARHTETVAARLVIVTRKRPGWRRGQLDVVSTSEVATVELGRRSLRGVAITHLHATSMQQSA